MGYGCFFSVRSCFGCLSYLGQFGIRYGPNLAELAIPCQQPKRVPNSGIAVHEPAPRSVLLGQMAYYSFFSEP